MARGSELHRRPDVERRHRAADRRAHLPRRRDILGVQRPTDLLVPALLRRRRDSGAAARALLMSEGAPAGGWEQVALELDRTPDDRTVRLLDDRLDTALVAQTGQADGESLALVLRDPGGRLVAGLH